MLPQDSHSLAINYQPLPDLLRSSLVGKPYPLPDFGLADPESLRGYRVALLTTHGPELPEFDVPLTYLRERGAAVEVLTQDWLFDWQPQGPGLVVLVQWIAANVCAKADKKISDGKVEDYDAIIIIGGAWNPIMLRTDDSMKNFVRAAHAQRKLIAAICHGPQLLISSKAFPSGTKATCVEDVRLDLANAGFKVLNGPDNAEEYDKAIPVVFDESQRLITSPNPNALSQFCEEIGRRLKESPIEPIQSDEMMLCDLVRRMGDAEKSRDVGFFKTLLAEKLTFRRANKTVVDKATFLTDLPNPTNTYEVLETEDVSAQIDGGVAVVTLFVRAKGTREGNPFAGLFRNIRIFVHEPDKEPEWQLHAWFNVRVSDAQL